MNPTAFTALSPDELHQRAEERLRTSPPKVIDPARQLHELQVHQIALEMQTDALRAACVELEVSGRRYAELFDHTPTPYFTLARDGVIRAVNLAGGGLFGVAPSLLLMRRFVMLIAMAERPAFHRFLDQAFAGGQREHCEATLPREGAAPRSVHLEAVADANGEECRIGVLAERGAAPRPAPVLAGRAQP